MSDQSSVKAGWWAAAGGGALLLLVMALLVPRTCAATIRVIDSAATQCGYLDYRPMVAIVAVIVVVLGGSISAIALVRRAEPPSTLFRAGIAITIAGPALGVLGIIYLASAPPFGALL